MSSKRKDLIFEKSDKLAVEVYKLTRKLPKEEMFGVTSQIRRASLSVVLNIVEGYARQQRNEHRRYLEISYGSLKETMYLLKFLVKVQLFEDIEIKKIYSDYEEVAKMLWSKIQTLKSR